jgi:hypothetical protein
MRVLRILICLLIIVAFKAPAQQRLQIGEQWTAEKANAWHSTHKWLSGANYIPATAINQLEMWQADTFDAKTIDTELSYAEKIGFNTMRVFLHSAAWKQDPAGFKKRMGEFLTIAQKHHIQPMFVFFDDCWNKEPKAGKQPEPKTGIHNSGWMQDPGQPASENAANFPELKKYVQDILKAFAQDKRILLWDLYNEPGNSGKGSKSLPLLTNVFAWARQINPSQPLSVGVWDWNLTELNNFQLMHSDVVTYHDYNPEPDHLKVIKFLKVFNRPLICTEYMARTRNSLFETVMPMMKKQNVGAINWGFVAGKTNTIYAWDNPMPNGGEPKLWFHDIFRKDGSVYKQEEVDVIKKLNGVN